MSAFIRPRRVDDPALRLVVCHHAGGSGSAYFPLARHLPADWDVLLVDLPGRGRRHRDTPLRDIGAMAARVTEDVLPWTGPPLALLGHSMGAVVAFETALRLQERAVPVAWVGVSGRLAPADCGPVAHLDPRLPDRELMAGLSAMGGIPERFDEAPEFRHRFLRLVRHDLHALGTAHSDAARGPLTAALTAYGAARDELAPAELIDNWAAETRGPFTRHVFDGGHFHFFDDGFAVLGRTLTADVRHALRTLDPVATGGPA
ncbi:thioesterase II family protein [Streptomyces sp. NPDC018584]|uniref:thioesterase II family protein n=1 Tax=unclassified Streptomyces TaxID=2593676 RepID=UPI00379D9705